MVISVLVSICRNKGVRSDLEGPFQTGPLFGGTSTSGFVVTDITRPLNATALT